MASRGRSIAKALLIVPLVGAGIGAMLALQSCGKQPEKRPATERSVAVRVLEMQPLAVVPRAVAQATVRPARTWQAIAQVSGLVTSLHDRLRVGEFLGADETLITIDETEYALQHAQAQAEIETLQAQQEEIDAQEKTYRASLAIEEASLVLAKNELTRLATLLESKKVSRSEKEQQERGVLDQEKLVQQTRNTIALLPSRRKVLATQLAGAHKRLALAALNVTRCTIKSPFLCRVATLSIEAAQVAGLGQVLCEVDAIDVVEVPTQFSLIRLTPLVPRDRTREVAQILRTVRLGELLRIEAKVFLTVGNDTYTWPARLARAEAVDPQTRTVTLVIEVDTPFRTSREGQSPPIFKGTHVSVVLSGEPQPDRFVVPRSALVGENRVYVVDAESRMQPQEVEVRFTQGSFACIGAGLASGDRVVVTDVITARPGLLLRPTVDTALAARLAAAAAGEGDVR